MADEGMVPELETKAKSTEGRSGIRGNGMLWSEREEAILRRYGGQVKVDDLLPYLDGRTAGAVRYKMHTMGLTKPRSRKPKVEPTEQGGPIEGGPQT